MAFKDARLSFMILGSLIVICGLLPSTDHFLHKFGYFRAFRLPADSMCPTLCKGERLVADMDAFLKAAPQRGDVIVFDYQSNGTRLTKRVIGVGGDIVSGTDGTILVNGKSFTDRDLPKVCGKPIVELERGGERTSFGPVTVPESSFFVIGDNLANSFDSRFPGFGLVTQSQVQGRPLYIYWSPGASRIGCPVR